jgi:hypothetical protein
MDRIRGYPQVPPGAASREDHVRAHARRRPVDGVPVTSDPAEAAPVYRPRYELAADQILRLISELALHPGDRMPTE